ncbi:MAG: nucleoside kinase [Candidatus Eisenbacteria bacterium]
MERTKVGSSKAGNGGIGKGNAANREIRVNVEGSRELSVPVGTTSLDLIGMVTPGTAFPIVAGRFNNKIVELKSPLKIDGTLVFVPLDSSDGMSVYRRSLTFVLIKATREVFNDPELYVRHSLSDGYYCEIDLGRTFELEDLHKLEARMREIVAADEPFVREEVTVQEALDIFQKDGQMDKVNVLKYRTEPTVNIYHLGKFTDYFYGALAPSTGYIKLFELRYYPPGFIMRFPLAQDPSCIPEFKEQMKMAEVFREFVKWGQILGIASVGDIDEIVQRGEASEMVRIAEALQEKKIGQMADVILLKLTRPRLVLVSGPSGSGKTTFSKRLAIQMRVNGLRTVILSLDNYFLDRAETPKDETGEYDFEAPEAIDIELLNSQLLELLAGKEVGVPRFSFRDGKRIGYRKLRLGSGEILILEGIHALNPVVTPSIPSIMKFRVYVSALSQLNVDHHNRVPTTDIRKLRRIVRDHLFRGYGAIDTLSTWQNVRRGEDLYIFPYQEEADSMFNSSLVYELCVLKGYTEKLLSAITDEVPEYAEARRLLRFLSYFLAIKAEEVPRNSILREFIGGSVFKY